MVRGLEALEKQALMREQEMSLRVTRMLRPLVTWRGQERKRR
jgi:hypothetical protein